MHYLSRLRSRAIVAGLVALVGAIAAPAVASAAQSHRSGFVYVNDNTAGSNTVAGFSRQADGRLTPLTRSPFEAGGAGNQ